jgi:citrate synthase
VAWHFAGHALRLCEPRAAALRGNTDSIRAALFAFADHELNASPFAVRCNASAQYIGAIDGVTGDATRRIKP